MCNCWYCKMFIRYETGRHEFSVPFRKMWFALPRYILKKNYEMDEEEKEEARRKDFINMRLKPVWGFILWVREGEAIPFAWWKKLIWTKK